MNKGEIMCDIKAIFKRRAAQCVIASLFILSGCSQPPTANNPEQVQEVSVTSLVKHNIKIEQSLNGRTVAYTVSDVRPQVGGIIQKRMFQEGQQVKEGQVLYLLDSKKYQAAYDSAEGDLAKADAAVESARQKAERYQSLVGIEAVSKQDAADAVSEYKQAAAAVISAKAALETAAINLGYTRITAPISGRISTSAYTPGALVTADQEDALTTIQQLDPIYVDVTETSARLLALRKRIKAGDLSEVQGTILVKIILEDGSEYQHKGELNFVGATVDTGTGSVKLRVKVPNPENLLLPGTYVQAVLPMAVNTQAILVPVSSVTRDSKGEPQVKIVGNDNKVVLQNIRTDSNYGNFWVVSGGLKAGDKLIVSGASSVSSGQTVKITQSSEQTAVTK